MFTIKLRMFTKIKKPVDNINARNQETPFKIVM